MVAVWTCVRQRIDKPRPSFDHLVGEQLYRVWHVEAECLGGLQVDDQLELGRLQDRQVGGFYAFEYPADVDAGLTVRVGDARTVAEQTARHGKFAELINRGKP